MVDQIAGRGFENGGIRIKYLLRSGGFSPQHRQTAVLHPFPRQDGCFLIGDSVPDSAYSPMIMTCTVRLRARV